jgi:hypothetical protein
MPGGFHPFHAGHYALYQSALEAFPDADVYVAATNDQKARPFPFSIKEKLAKLAGVAPGRFIQVKSPFKAEEITSQYNPNEDVLIFVRSEKDRNEQPKPGGVKKDGNPAYFQPWTGKDLKPFSQHAYIDYLPTVEFGPGIKSATEIRNAWPNLNDRQKTAMVMSLYPVTQKNPKLAKNVVELLNVGMSGEVSESYSRKVVEDVNLAGLSTGLSDINNPKIRDDETYNYYSVNDFFSKFPQYNRKDWENAYAQWLEKRKQRDAERAKRTATNISGNPVSPEQAQREQQYLLKLLSPEEQALYKKLYTSRNPNDKFKAGRLLKQAWGRKVQQDQMKKLLKVHWTKVSELPKFFNGSLSPKTELSAVMYASKSELPNKPSWGGAYDETVGLVLDGWVTVAGGMDLSSDNRRADKGSAASQQKYTFMPDRIDTDVSQMRTTKAELGSSWNEALVDNWRITSIVITDGLSNETLNQIKQLNLPIIDARSTQQGLAETGINSNETSFIDQETEKILKYAKAHYPQSASKQQAFVMYVLRALKHSEQDDDDQDEKINKLQRAIKDLEAKVNSPLHENKDYLDEV